MHLMVVTQKIVVMLTIKESLRCVKIYALFFDEIITKLNYHIKNY
jgi:hypothetical protein